MASKWIATFCGNYIDPKTGADVRFERGDAYRGPNPEKYAIKQEIVVPAPAGSSQPGTDEERDEA